MKKHARILIGIFGVVVLGVFFWPLPHEFSRLSNHSLRLTDRNGALLYDVRSEGVSNEVLLSSLPEDFTNAIIATEDRTFYLHAGLSIRGILRAAWHDIQAGSIVEGGSTITQQLVRIALRPKRRGIAYKLREALLAIKIDLFWSKDQILEAYINSAYFGHQSYGISAAARTYFDKSPISLSIAESALLAGLVNAPTSLNPFKDTKAALTRRNLVLRAMRETKKITSDEYEAAVEEPVKLSHGKVPIQAPHFVFWVLSQYPDSSSEGDDIQTTLDVSLQHEVEDIVHRQIEVLEDQNVTSAAVVVMDAHTGDVLVMVGSNDYFDDEHDGAVNVATSLRQPGSALKPFTYALALKSGMTAATTISDTEVRYFTQDGNPYTPRNYDYLEHGLVRLREALANSYNIAAVRVLEKVGVEKLLVFLKQAGISSLNESPEHYGLALTLGDSEVRLLDLVAAYGIFPRGGKTLHPRSLLREKVIEGTKVISPQVAWIISDILSDNDARRAEFGERNSLSFPFPVAAKTGTTRNSRDNWTIGYTPEYLVGVWVGNANNTPMIGTSGVTGAGPIFYQVVKAVSKTGNHPTFTRPEGIEQAEICRLSGKLPTDLCQERMTEYFVSGTAPREFDDIYKELAIDTRNQLLASTNCPENVMQKQLFTVFPKETENWARENGWNVPPPLFSPLCEDTSSHSQQNDLEITHPLDNASFYLDPLIPDDKEQIIFEALSSKPLPSISWYVDGEFIGEGKSPNFRLRWTPIVGEHSIRAGSGADAQAVKIEIKR